jgi:hypothetical protein
LIKVGVGDEWVVCSAGTGVEKDREEDMKQVKTGQLQVEEHLLQVEGTSLRSFETSSPYWRGSSQAREFF